MTLFFNTFMAYISPSPPPLTLRRTIITFPNAPLPTIFNKSKSPTDRLDSSPRGDPEGLAPGAFLLEEKPKILLKTDVGVSDLRGVEGADSPPAVEEEEEEEEATVASFLVLPGRFSDTNCDAKASAGLDTPPRQTRK